MRLRTWSAFATLAVLSGVAGGVALLRQSRSSNEQPAKAAAPSFRVAAPVELGEPIYDGKLAAGWEDWGWSPHQISTGPAKIQFSSYGGITLHHTVLDARFGALVFRYKTPSGWPEFLSASLKGSTSEGVPFPVVLVQPRHIAHLPDDWSEALIPISELDPSNAPFDKVTLAARVPVSPDWVLLDKIALTKLGSAAQASAPVRPVSLSILCSAPTHKINPLIYGGTMGSQDSVQTARRIGGNPLTRFNWDLGAWNTASDWFFENVRVDGGLAELLARDPSRQEPAALVVPMIGWVAKDELAVGFPAAKFANQRKHDPNRAEAGDGFGANGSTLQPGPPTQTSVPAPPELIGRWVRSLRDGDRTRGSRSVGMYILDNEPSLWDVTHRDVHPDPLTYDELLDRSIKYATEIRQADPDALIAGPAEWGWTAYFDSAKDRNAGTARPDRRAHGDLPLIPWYLAQLSQHERTTGKRLLDVLDVHFYPAADGLSGTNARTDAEAAALRLRSTRALWDPDYRDESWIGQPVRLIPRLKEWVAENYPGRQVSLGEWSFGADDHVSGGLATVEALGRFGQQGLDMAFFWGGPKVDTPAFWAFRAFRNFDGSGARFLDTSLATREDENVSLFASRDDSGAHIVAILVNRDPALAMRARVELDGCGQPASRRVFKYGPGDTALIADSAGATAGQVVEELVPPYSFRVIDIRLRAP